MNLINPDLFRSEEQIRGESKIIQDLSPPRRGLQFGREPQKLGIERVFQSVSPGIREGLRGGAGGGGQSIGWLHDFLGSIAEAGEQGEKEQRTQPAQHSHPAPGSDSLFDGRPNPNMNDISF